MEFVTEGRSDEVYRLLARFEVVACLSAFRGANSSWVDMFKISLKEREGK